MKISRGAARLGLEMVAAGDGRSDDELRALFVELDELDGDEEADDGDA